MKILLSGGGTLGPVTPLIAIKEIISESKPDTLFVWVGTASGPEKELVEKSNMRFYAIRSGKLRRYISLLNIIDCVNILLGTTQSLFILIKQRPDLCISAGGFVSVPLHIAAWLMGVPTWIHQQDVRVGLANRLMAPLASRITTATEAGKSFFSAKKTVWLGNPIRQDVLQGKKEHAIQRFGLSGRLPVIFATGGGTGSLRVNQLIAEVLPHLEGTAEVVHLSGKERPQELVERAQKHFSFYHYYQFFTDEMKDAYAIADIVISRGGFGTMSELAALKKASIFIPKPGHQVENVRFLETAHAAVVLDENFTNGLELAKHIKQLLTDSSMRQTMGEHLHHILPQAKKDEIIHLVEQLVPDITV